MGTLTDVGTRTVDTTRSNTATRNIVCFEILDYDSLTYIKVGEDHVNVVALIYKKVTIYHSQTRKYEIHSSIPSGDNLTFDYFPVDIHELELVPAQDNYDFNGTRIAEYILCVLVGENKYTKSLGTVNIGITGSDHMSGINIELIEGAGYGRIQSFKESTTYIPTLSGERLYGVSVNCGKDMVTFSYDLEKIKLSVPLPTSGLDSPVNFEDYNGYWEKYCRVVGVMNYYGILDSKIFSYTGSPEETGVSGTAGFPDKVLAIGYKK